MVEPCCFHPYINSWLRVKRSLLSSGRICTCFFYYVEMWPPPPPPLTCSTDQWQCEGQQKDFSECWSRDLDCLSSRSWNILNLISKILLIKFCVATAAQVLHFSKAKLKDRNLKSDHRTWKIHISFQTPSKTSQYINLSLSASAFETVSLLYLPSLSGSCKCVLGHVNLNGR